MENPLCDDDQFAATQPVDNRVLKDVVAYVEVRTTNDNRSEAVRRELEQLGATVVKKFTNDVTHVVFKEGSNRTKTKAQKKGVHFVSVLWVDSCKQNQEHVSERMYPAIVAKHKGPNLFIAKLKKAKSMQPRDFEEEVSRSAERVSRKKRRIEALDRLQSAGNTPHSSPRSRSSPLVLVQDTQPRSPEDGFSLTPIRLTIPDTPPSMREKMKQLKIGIEGSYNEAGPDGRKCSSRDFLYDREPLQRKLFTSSGVSFDTLASFDSPGPNSVFTSGDDTKDTTGNASHLSEDDDTEVQCDEESPVPADPAKTAGTASKALTVKFSPIAEDKDEDIERHTSQTVSGESDSSVMEDILNIAGKINATMNIKNAALDDSVDLNTETNLGVVGNKELLNSLEKVTEGTLDNESKRTKIKSKRTKGNQISCNNSAAKSHENKEIDISDEKNHTAEVNSIGKNTRRKSRRISFQNVSIQNKIADVQEPQNTKDCDASLSVENEQLSNVKSAMVDGLSKKEEKDRTSNEPEIICSKEKKVEKLTEIKHTHPAGKIDKEANLPNEELQAEVTTCNPIPEVNKGEVDKSGQETSRKSRKSKVDRRKTISDAENKTSKTKTMPKKKLLSLTDLNEPHSVLIEPNKCSDIERPELMDNKPKGKRRRKNEEDLNSVSCDDVVDDNSKVKKISSEAVISSDQGREQKRQSEQNENKVDKFNDCQITNETEKNKKQKTSRKRQSKQNNNPDKSIKDNAAIQNQEIEHTTEAEIRGRKRKSKTLSKAGGKKSSPKQPRRESLANHSKQGTQDKELIRVNDTIVRDKGPDINSSVTSHLHDITTQLNLTANNSVTASLRDGTLSLSMSAVYNTDTTMQSFLVSQTQRKSIDEFNLSQKNRNKERTKVVAPTMKEDRRNEYKSSSDSDNSVSGKSRKKYRPSLVMTSLHLHEQDVVISVVKKLGGFVIAENVNETTTHVICGEPRRTLNVLQCLARGAWLLNKSWVIKSLEAGAWIQEEEYECKQLFPVCKVARLEREATEGYYKQQLFTNVGSIYVSGRSSPPRQQLVQLIKLCGGQVLNKCPDLQDVSKLYTSEESKMEMLDAINVTIEESIDNDIRYSDYLGLIVDESTDITIHKKLCIYVKCLSYESKEPTIHFLDCIAVPDGKAETIVSEIEKLFQSKNIPWEKLSSLASDGAAVMIGRKSGVGVRLKEHSKNLVQVHCVAHKLALAAGQSCKDITLFNEYQLTLKQIYRFFSNSAVRYNGLRAMMEILEDEDMKYVTLKEPASFRWLSLEGAVKAVSDVYPALYSALENDAAKGNTEAKGLFLKVKSVGFVLVTAFLRDTLGCVGKLSRVFQKDDLDISVINTMVESTKEKLMLLKTNNGSELSKTYENIDDGQYRGVKILDKQQTRIGFQNASSDYLDKLNNNIEERFESDSMRTLNLLNVVLNPALVPKNSTLNEYGQAELSELGDIYCDFVDKDRMSDDYYQLKVVLKTMPADSSLRAACQHLISKYSDVFPDFVTLSKLLLVCPVTSVACEHGFSSHNRIKTKGRGKLKHSTVTKLMSIMEEGPQLDKYDPKPAVKAFISSKKRRK